MANFTPEEISEILSQFFDVVGKRQYIGARYVPIFGRKNEATIIWDNTKPYEPLTIVLYQGNSYTSRQYVPTGVDITDEGYWALTGNYNAQVESYRQEVINLRDDYTEYKADMNDAWDDYKSDMNDEWSDYKTDLFGDLEDWKDETVDDFETAIDGAPARITALEYETPFMVDLFGYIRAFDIGLYGQSVLFVGERLFAGGQGTENNDSVIVEFDTTTGQEITHAIIPELGHMNGMCTKDGFIYTFNGNTVYQINIDSLSIVGQNTYAELANINNCFTKDDYVYVIQNNKKVYKIVDSSTVEYQFTMPNLSGATQNSVYYDGKIYQAYTMPNRIVVVDFETQSLEMIRELPKGDGIYPMNEVEGMFIKDDVLYVTSGPYINNGHNYIDTRCQLVSIFMTSLISNITLTDNTERFVARDINVNGNVTPTFKPNISSLYSYQIAGEVASYLNHCSISVANMNETKESLILRDCTATINLTSGARKFDAFAAINSDVTIEAINNVDKVHINHSVVKFFTCLFDGTDFYSYSCDTFLNNVYFKPASISGKFSRSRIYGTLAEIAPFSAGALVSPTDQLNLNITMVGNSNLIYLLEFADAENSNRGMPVSLLYKDIIVRFVLRQGELRNFIQQNDVIVTTLSTAYPKIKLEYSTGRIYLSTEAAPDTFSINVTSYGFNCSINQPSIFVV